MSFKDFLQRKKESGTLYQATFIGNNICGNCDYRQPFKNNCLKFNNPIERIRQRNGGFHHLPCKECLEYFINSEDLIFIEKSYNKRKGGENHASK